jgi:hypothetical protein
MTWVQDSHAEKMHRLIDLVRLNPCVRSCIQLISSEVVPQTVEVLEQDKPLQHRVYRDERVDECRHSFHVQLGSLCFCLMLG